jgi:ribosome biogenesis protein NSA2
MPQNEHIELHTKRHGRRLDAAERERKRDARMVHRRSEIAQKSHGLKAKLLNKKRFKEKAENMRVMNKCPRVLCRHTFLIVRVYLARKF